MLWEKGKPAGEHRASIPPNGQTANFPQTPFLA